MINSDKVIGFDNVAAIGEQLVALLGRVEALERITPGVTGDWGLAVGGHVYQLTIAVRRDIEVPA